MAPHSGSSSSFTGTSRDVPSAVYDEERLDELRATRLLEEDIVENFDWLTDVAVREVGADAGFVSLLSDEGHFLRGCVGMPEEVSNNPRTPIEYSVCAYTLDRKEPLVIGDVEGQPEIANHPVIKTYDVRGYLGVPLLSSSGRAIGTFCLVEWTPRDWSASDVETARRFARLAQTEVELRLELHKREELEEHLEERVAQRTRELKEAKEEAEATSRLKSALLANMSHEIRTPLTSIIGFAEVIGEDDTAAARFAPLIEKSGRRLLETLNGVLNLSKLEAGDMTLQSKPIDLVDEAVAAVEQFRLQAEKTDIDLAAEAEPASVWARADEGGVQIAINNLLSNALKYTDEGGVVRVRTARDGEDAVLTVEDTGIGMAPDRVPELFEAFKQESVGLGREYEGTGLGLAVTKRVVEQMGGSMAVETEKGTGSRFSVRLPAGRTGPQSDARS